MDEQEKEPSLNDIIKSTTLQHLVKYVPEFNLYDQGQIDKSWKNIELLWEEDDKRIYNFVSNKRIYNILWWGTKVDIADNSC